MRHTKHLLIFILLALTVVLLVACGGEETTESPKPAEVEAVEGSEFNLVTLTERAAERLGIESVAVQEEEVDGDMRMVIPYSAVIYGLNGETWAYIRNPAPDSLAFTRHPITVEYIEGGRAILTDGPPLDTHVVTVGVAELYGTDTGVGK